MLVGADGSMLSDSYLSPALRGLVRKLDEQDKEGLHDLSAARGEDKDDLGAILGQISTDSRYAISGAGKKLVRISTKEKGDRIEVLGEANCFSPLLTNVGASARWSEDTETPVYIASGSEGYLALAGKANATLKFTSNGALLSGGFIRAHRRSNDVAPTTLGAHSH